MVDHQATVEHEGRVIERLERHQLYAAVVEHEEAAAGEVALRTALLAGPQLDTVDAVVVFDVPAGERVPLEDSDTVFGGTQPTEHSIVHLCGRNGVGADMEMSLLKRT